MPLNPRYISLVIDAADRGDGMRLRELLAALHPADLADLLGFLSEDYREQIIPWIPPSVMGDLLAELDDDIREEVIRTLHTNDIAEVLQELDSGRCHGGFRGFGGGAPKSRPGGAAGNRA